MSSPRSRRVKAIAFALLVLPLVGVGLTIKARKEKTDFEFRTTEAEARAAGFVLTLEELEKLVPGPSQNGVDILTTAWKAIRKPVGFDQWVEGTSSSPAYIKETDHLLAAVEQVCKLQSDWTLDPRLCHAFTGAHRNLIDDVLNVLRRRAYALAQSDPDASIRNLEVAQEFGIVLGNGATPDSHLRGMAVLNEMPNTKAWLANYLPTSYVSKLDPLRKEFLFKVDLRRAIRVAPGSMESMWALARQRPEYYGVPKPYLLHLNEPDTIKRAKSQILRFYMARLREVPETTSIDDFGEETRIAAMEMLNQTGKDARALVSLHGPRERISFYEKNYLNSYPALADYFFEYCRAGKPARLLKGTLASGEAIRIATSGHQTLTYTFGLNRVNDGGLKDDPCLVIEPTKVNRRS